MQPSLPDADTLRGLDADTRESETSQAAHEIVGFFPRLDALVIGPGLGRDATVLAVAERAVRSSKHFHV